MKDTMMMRRAGTSGTHEGDEAPVEGCAQENCASVLASSAIATMAATMVSGAAMPAVTTMSPKLK